MQSKYKFIEAVAVISHNNIQVNIVFKQKSDDYVKIYIDVKETYDEQLLKTDIDFLTSFFIAVK